MSGTHGLSPPGVGQALMKTTREKPAHLHSTQGTVQAAAPGEGFFALLQQIEDQHAQWPLLGTALRLREDCIRLGQHPHLDFATRDFKREALIDSGLVQGEVRKLYLQNFGLLGPHGALPLHYTEHACNRLQHFNDPTFSEFLDVFHHRFYLLFYRAWADAQPNVGYHRPFSNPFARHLNSLLGHDLSGTQGREVLSPGFRASLAGHFSRFTKTTEGLVSLLTACTGQPVEVLPFRACWLNLGKGVSEAALGQGAMLGSRSWSAQSSLDVRIGPMPFAVYQQLLPGQLLRKRLFQAVHAYLGHEFDCDFLLDLLPGDVPVARLCGVAQLGRTAWLGPLKGNPVNPGSTGISGYPRQPAAVRLKCPAVPVSPILS